MPITKNNILIPSILAALSWIGLITAIVVLKPEGIATLVFFFVLFFVAIFLTTVLLFPNRRRAMLIACGLSSFLLLRFFQLDSLINSILLASFLVTFEIYFWKK